MASSAGGATAAAAPAVAAERGAAEDLACASSPAPRHASQTLRSGGVSAGNKPWKAIIRDMLADVCTWQDTGWVVVTHLGMPYLACVQHDVGALALARATTKLTVARRRVHYWPAGTDGGRSGCKHALQPSARRLERRGEG